MIIGAIVLAAGRSQRMGRAKQTLPVGGQAMLARVVETILAAKLDQVVVVLGASAPEIAPLLAGLPVTVTYNPRWREGLSSSLRAGLAALPAGARAALFVPADLPHLTARTVRMIVDCFDRTGKGIVIPTCGGRRGNPVLFAHTHFVELLHLQGDQGGRALFSGHKDDITFVETGDEGILLDVDTPDDYKRVTRQE